VIAVFEEHPEEFLAHAETMCPGRETMRENGLLEVIYLRPLDLSVDEALLAIQAAVKRTCAQRLVIDSLSGLSWRSRRRSERTSTSHSIAWSAR
jgi:circadian clock protein KaiC